MLFVYLMIGYFVTGAFAGLLSGLLGVGGGIIVVPALLVLYKFHGYPESIRMHMAIGTSLAVIIVTTIRSLIAHYSYHSEAWQIYRKMIVGVAIGVAVGALFANSLHSNTLQVIFGVFVLVLAVKTLFFSKITAKGTLPRPWVKNLVSFFIGGKSGLLGLGGGAVTIPYLLYFNVSMREAVVVSIMTSLTVSTVGTICYLILGSMATNIPHFSTGYIHWPAWFGTALGSVIFAPIGARWSFKLPVETLRKIFAVVLILIGARLVA